MTSSTGTPAAFWLLLGGVLVVPVLVGWGVGRVIGRREAKELQVWRASEAQALSNLVIPSNDTRMALMGADAYTAQCEEEAQRADGVLLGLRITRVLRNPAGEYFYWLWRTEERPFVKHIPHGNAKILLKEKYLAPPPETS